MKIGNKIDPSDAGVSRYIQKKLHISNNSTQHDTHAHTEWNFTL